MYLKYLKSVLRHKWFVFLEACKLGIPWRGFMHDMSKFLPDEFFPYARYFWGTRRDEKVKHEFAIAWKRHQHRNPHHWQWWVKQDDQPEGLWAVEEAASGGIGLFRSGVYGLLFVDTGAKFSCEILEKIAALLNNDALAMPDNYRREMLADWRGAGRTYGNTDTAGWYEKTRAGRVLHPETQAWIEEQLGIIDESLRS